MDDTFQIGGGNRRHTYQLPHLTEPASLGQTSGYPYLGVLLHVDRKWRLRKFVVLGQLPKRRPSPA